MTNELSIKNMREWKDLKWEESRTQYGPHESWL